MERKVKIIFVTGGVISSLGKGIASASIGLLLREKGFKVTAVKVDPYINVDAGTMNPYQHGEVFVTDDGAETDLDLGHYERFLETTMEGKNNITTGKIYLNVIEKERKGDYLGATVQVIPHLTDEIKREISEAVKNYEIAIVEIGGTVGDIESLPFLEAARQMYLESPQDVAFVHLTLVPYVPSAGELKTKPTQHSVQKLREIGIQPDILITRTPMPLGESVKKKISLFTNVPLEAVIEGVDVPNIYRIPLIFREQGLANILTERLSLSGKKNENNALIEKWKEFVRRVEAPTEGEVEIALVGKYVKLKDSYKSVEEALKHAAAWNDVALKIRWVDSEDIEENGPGSLLEGVNGVLVPGGFGHRGIQGKIKAIEYARENNIPFLGLCLGMQLAVIEFTRNVLGLKEANSTEFDPNTPYPVIDLLPEQKKIKKMGGTMRLGAYPAHLVEGSKARKLYKKGLIYERHRHRYEFNNEFKEKIENKGMKITGIYQEKQLAEIVEIPEHPFFIATQFHPEFKSKPLAPHPLFMGFIRSAKEARA